MVALAMLGGVLLAAALLLRELLGLRARNLQADEHEQLRQILSDTQNELRRAVEDVQVLQAVLEEKHLLDEGDLARGRIRFIETPRRVAAQRAEIARTLNVSPTQLVVDDNLDKVH